MNKITLSLSLLALSTIASAAVVRPMCTDSAGSNVTSLSVGCTGGGLLFDMFTVNSTPQGTNIYISANGTGPISNPQGFSLGFQILTPSVPIDTILEYRVTTLGERRTIIGVDNGQNGIDTTIQEVVCDQAFTGGICATGHVIANFSNPPTPNNTEVLLSGGPRSQIFIMKDIAEPSRESFISSFVNSHETSTVPEPSTSALLGAGLCCLSGLARKLRRS